MPALRPIPPRRLRELLERHGFSVRFEDDQNWALVRSGHEDIVMVPKGGRLVGIEVLHRALDAAQIDNATFLAFLAEVPETEL